MNLPIGAWLTTNDRGVPHEFIGRRVSELFAVDFETLARGISLFFLGKRRSVKGEYVAGGRPP